MASTANGYDWIVIGGGLAGSAAAYELARQGLSVLLLEAQSSLQATRYSYGGIPYWAGTTPLMQQLCQEGIERHRTLPEELEADTQLRELDLLLTIAEGQDPNQALQTYASCQVPPTLLSTSEARQREPQLSPAIAGALTVRHGHVDPIRLVDAYRQAFTRLGGKVQGAEVTRIVQQREAAQVVADEQTWSSANALVCAGGLSRRLLAQSGFTVRQYFTHAELVETPPLPPLLQTLVMPAHAQRFELEAEATAPQHEPLWQQETQHVVSAILDPGAIQFLEGRICLGQTSGALGNPFAPVDLAQREAEIRQAVGQVLPALADLPGECRHCLVAFSGDRLPLIGPVPGADNLHLFSGFGSPFAILPPLAQRFAAHATAVPDDIIASLSPRRPGLLLDRSGR